MVAAANLAIPTVEVKAEEQKKEPTKTDLKKQQKE